MKKLSTISINKKDTNEVFLSGYFKKVGERMHFVCTFKYSEKLLSEIKEKYYEDPSIAHQNIQIDFLVAKTKGRNDKINLELFLETEYEEEQQYIVSLHILDFKARKNEIFLTQVTRPIVTVSKVKRPEINF